MRACEQSESQAACKCITVLLEVEGGSDLSLDADPKMLSAMLGALLAGALRLAPVGATIRLAARRRGAHARISVSDNGPAVAAPDMKRIVHPFEKIIRDGKAIATGLDLTVVKTLAELHGGRVAVTSALGRGLISTVELPMPQGS